jgi:hypothetical protein
LWQKLTDLETLTSVKTKNDLKDEPKNVFKNVARGVKIPGTPFDRLTFVEFSGQVREEIQLSHPIEESYIVKN